MYKKTFFFLIKLLEQNPKKSFLFFIYIAARRPEPQQQQQRRQQQNRGRKCFGIGEWEENNSAPKRAASSTLFDKLPFGKFVLHLIGGRNCIRTSAQRLNIEYVEKEVGDVGERKYVAYLRIQIFNLIHKFLFHILEK